MAENNIKGFRVKGQLYDIPQYYRHIVDCRQTAPSQCYDGMFRLEIINENPNQLDFESLYEYLDIMLSWYNTYPCLVSIDGHGDSKASKCYINYDSHSIMTDDYNLWIDAEYHVIEDIIIPLITPEHAPEPQPL